MLYFQETDFVNLLSATKCIKWWEEQTKISWPLTQWCVIVRQLNLQFYLALDRNGRHTLSRRFIYPAGDVLFQISLWVMIELLLKVRLHFLFSLWIILLLSNSMNHVISVPRHMHLFVSSFFCWDSIIWNFLSRLVSMDIKIWFCFSVDQDFHVKLWPFSTTLINKFGKLKS